MPAFIMTGKLISCGCHSEDLETYGPANLFASAQGIIVPGGFGNRGIEGMIAAATMPGSNQYSLPGAVSGYAGHGY